MRQKESQYLANDIEEIKKLPEWTQQKVGYRLSRSFLGRVNLSNLMLVLLPGVRTDTSIEVLNMDFHSLQSQLSCQSELRTAS
jgi:hypothetical protein